MTGEGWVPACARTTGGGDDGGGMGPRMREDNEGGGDDGGGMGPRMREDNGGGEGAWRKRPQRLVSWRGTVVATAKRPVECR